MTLWKWPPLCNGKVSCHFFYPMTWQLLNESFTTWEFILRCWSVSLPSKAVCSAGFNLLLWSDVPLWWPIRSGLFYKKIVQSTCNGKMGSYAYYKWWVYVPLWINWILSSGVQELLAVLLLARIIYLHPLGLQASSPLNSSLQSLESHKWTESHCSELICLKAWIKCCPCGYAAWSAKCSIGTSARSWKAKILKASGLQSQCQAAQAENVVMCVTFDQAWENNL